MTGSEFYINKRVKMKDEEDGVYVYGRITDIQSDFIIVKWNDIESPCQHYADEWPLIKDGNPH
jgi:hypothetical protein